ncbi:DUF3168 domain-containing protein [Dysgonomonas sp. GY617]|uniref:DUF3168 domain-containing protein n=1 Tax=Dysgonomonas sp. GY617 TaxID=2780420 RepID=UPI0018832808|nr:DUF3168 domain-containing protein [Dysgonomonas sp. GY617]MBF0577738.1 DUF3168 domain-containing protein [Dysgonomonas sp. GY617]
MSANSKFKITTEIRDILLGEPKITIIIGDQIFPVVAPKDTPGSFIIYRRDEYSISYNKMGIHEQSCKVYISAISDKYGISQELAYQINECLKGTFSNPQMTIRLLDSTEDFEDAKYIQTLLFEII